MRQSLGWLIAGALWILWTPPVYARSNQAVCKKIREAIAKGETLEQITAEFETDAAHVMKCTQTRSHRRTKPKTTKPSRTKKSPKSAAPSSRNTGGEPTTPQSPPVPRRSVLGQPHP